MFIKGMLEQLSNPNNSSQKQTLQQTQNQRSQSQISFKKIVQQKYPTKQQESSFQYNNYPNPKFKPDNLLSQILDYEVYKQKNLNPEFLRIKNNILLIFLILSSYGIYYLFNDFLNVMLLAFIGGVGYQQMRQRFYKFWKSSEPFFQKQMTMTVRIISMIGYVLLILMLPWMRNFLANPGQFKKHLEVIDVFNSLSLKMNPIVLILQLFLLLKVLHLILAPKIFPILAEYAPRQERFYKIAFFLIFFTVTFVAISVIPSLFIMEISYGGFWVEDKIEAYVGCQIIPTSSHNSSKLPLCSEMFFKNNTFFEDTFKEFKAQTSQIQDCIAYVNGLERSIFGEQVFIYEEIACTWFLIVQKATTYFRPDSDVIATGTTFFKTVFGNIATIISYLSNFIFASTTFLTIFYLTVEYFDSRSSMIKQIFYGQRKELLGQITNLIQATLFIVVEHFLMSIVLLQMLNFSYFNMIIATFLSSMAFVPFFRPWFGAAFFSIIRSIFTGSYFINIIFVAVYYYLSERIFSARFKEMSFHEIITNLSVLFGIYQFGIAGIFYGPIILILFKSVHRQLLRNEVYNSPSDEHGGEIH